MKRKQNPMHYWKEYKLVQPLWKTVQRFLKEFKNRTTKQSGNSAPGYLENENTIQKRYMHPYIYCGIIYNTQDMETS